MHKQSFSTRQVHKFVNEDSDFQINNESYFVDDF